MQMQLVKETRVFFSPIKLETTMLQEINLEF